MQIHGDTRSPSPRYYRRITHKPKVTQGPATPFRVCRPEARKPAPRCAIHTTTTQERDCQGGAHHPTLASSLLNKKGVSSNTQLLAQDACDDDDRGREYFTQKHVLATYTNEELANMLSLFYTKDSAPVASTVSAEDLVGLGFSYEPVSYIHKIQSQPTKKNLLWGKSARPKCHF